MIRGLFGEEYSFREFSSSFRSMASKPTFSVRLALPGPSLSTLPTSLPSSMKNPGAKAAFPCDSEMLHSKSAVSSAGSACFLLTFNCATSILFAIRTAAAWCSASPPSRVSFRRFISFNLICGVCPSNTITGRIPWYRSLQIRLRKPIM